MKRIYITVDTECHDINWQDRYIWGKNRKGEYWGLDKILALGKELNIPINFFVDIPEANRYGEEFTKTIVEKIHAAGQNAYVHLHPNYITGEDEQTYFWKYGMQEKREILAETKQLAERFLSDKEKFVFRIGRYGADPEMYEVIREVFGSGVIDLSYCYECEKMCHVNQNDINTKNNVTDYKDSVAFPNTRYIGFRFGKREKVFNIDAADTQLGEFKALIDQNALDNITLTMHSWNFIKVFFFCKKRVWANKSAYKKFRAMVAYAQQKGYVFSDIADCRKDIIPSNTDQVIDLCSSSWGIIKAIGYNFMRFQNIALLNKKYFIVYTFFYLMLFIALVAIVLEFL